jgi:restriction endonuclease S subunit
LLPFFNEKIRIADFKDEICNELKNYSEEIERLRKQMDKFASSAEKVKN